MSLREDASVVDIADTAVYMEVQHLFMLFNVYEQWRIVLTGFHYFLDVYRKETLHATCVTGHFQTFRGSNRV